jgi:hypothetical protein
MKQITLYWPDDQMVAIHLGGKHVADVTSVGLEFPTDLFNLLLALPYMTEALKVAVTGLDFAQAQVESENDAYQLRQWLMEVKRVLNKVENGESKGIPPSHNLISHRLLSQNYIDQQ